MIWTFRTLRPPGAPAWWGVGSPLSGQAGHTLLRETRPASPPSTPPSLLATEAPDGGGVNQRQPLGAGTLPQVGADMGWGIHAHYTDIYPALPFPPHVSQKPCGPDWELVDPPPSRER